VAVVSERLEERDETADSGQSSATGRGREACGATAVTASTVAGVVPVCAWRAPVRLARYVRVLFACGTEREELCGVFFPLLFVNLRPCRPARRAGGATT
jgi:hypothetical protein